MRSSIIPTTTLTTFQIHIAGAKTVACHVGFYRYMTQKYANVTHITYSDSMLREHSYQKRMEVYMEGIVDFYKILGQNRTKLNICCLPNHVNLFKSLDELGARLTHLSIQQSRSKTLFQYLKKSNQYQYIQVLVLESASIHPYGIFKDMRSLTELYSNMYAHPWADQEVGMNLTRSLNGCQPTLKKLTVKCPAFKMDTTATNITSIESLEIKNIELTKQLGTVISNCFPQLFDLSCDGLIKHNVSVAIQSLGFQSAMFRTADIAHHVLVLITPAQTKWYSCDRKGAVISTQEGIQGLGGGALMVTRPAEKRV